MSKITQRIGKTLGRYTVGNRITLAGGLLALLGIYLFGIHQDWLAIMVLAVSFLTDFFDGLVSRYHESLRRAAGLSPITKEAEDALGWIGAMNHRGESHLGKWMDPLVDKIRYVGLLWVLAPGVVPVELIINLTAMAILLTFVRPILRWLDLGDGASNRFGKIKVHVEVLSMACLVFTTRPLFGETNALQTIPVVNIFTCLLLLSALILSISSFVTHVHSGWLAYKAKHP